MCLTRQDPQIPIVKTNSFRWSYGSVASWPIHLVNYPKGVWPHYFTSPIGQDWVMDSFLPAWAGSHSSLLSLASSSDSIPNSLLLDARKVAVEWLGIELCYRWPYVHARDCLTELLYNTNPVTCVILHNACDTPVTWSASSMWLSRSSQEISSCPTGAYQLVQHKIKMMSNLLKGWTLQKQA